MALRSEINADVPVAAPGEFAPLPLTDAVSLWPPVVLAPMAGVTNPPYRTLCRRMGAGLYVAEMVHSRGLSERNARTVGMASFADDEPIRSIQIFGADPSDMADATRFLVQEVGVDHIDINLGCPVRKVTGRGSGSALPARPELMGRVLSAVVQAAGEVPVTTKIRLGLDDERHTWADALAATTDSGCRWMGVHARTAQAGYSGQADWDWIGRIVEQATIPILGNGDIWEAWDALRMMRATGCHGVIIGRGCLGRPWLFRELAQVFDGVEPADPPALGEVLGVVFEHAQMLVDYFGPKKGILEMRKWCSWYTKGFPGSAVVREGLQHIDTLEDMRDWLSRLDPDIPFPARALRVPRAKRGHSQDKVHLPHGWLDEEGVPDAEATEAGETEPDALPPGAESPRGALERRMSADENDAPAPADRPMPPERPPEGAADAPPLFVPDEPFPPYRFVPGHTPHPFMKGGYAHGTRHEDPPYLTLDDWTRNAAYLRGVDFFNRGWWWEAHEEWEGAWRTCEGRDEPQRHLMQGLIQLAACALNRERGHDRGAGRLLETGTDYLRRAAEQTGSELLGGLDLAALRDEATTRLGVASARVDGFYLRPGAGP